MNRPYAESSDQNKAPILAILSELFTEAGSVLEIGAGTGQHAAFFAKELPHIQWLPTDVAAHLPGIEAWRAHAAVPNLLPARELNVLDGAWPEENFDGVFSANTAHIMSWAGVEAMFAGVGRVLKAGGCFALYGPFHYDGQPTSESNVRFDAWLRQRDPDSGVRDVQDLRKLANDFGMTLLRDFDMPANNRTLIWMR